MKKINNKKKNNHGFTLIELLVVISIIALLSTIVLASLQTARAKSRDAKRIELVKEYANALELYRTDNGTYPVVTTGTYYCLGEAQTGTNNECYGASSDGLTSLNNLLKTYIPGPPASTDPLVVSGNDLHGIVYTLCPTNGGVICPAAYQLKWYMEVNPDGCAGGVNKLNSPPLIMCVYPQ